MDRNHLFHTDSTIRYIHCRRANNNFPSSLRPSDVQAVMDSLFPDLKTILCLLTNALEVLNFLQTKMGDYIQGDGEGDQQERETRDREEEAGGSGVENEAVVELEEVVMYTFQQVVYYLTKVNNNNNNIYVPAGGLITTSLR